MILKAHVLDLWNLALLSFVHQNTLFFKRAPKYVSSDCIESPFLEIKSVAVSFVRVSWLRCAIVCESLLSQLMCLVGWLVSQPILPLSDSLNFRSSTDKPGFHQRYIFRFHFFTDRWDRSWTVSSEIWPSGQKCPWPKVWIFIRWR